jgi:MFS family permease
VGGDVDVGGGTIELGPGARIGGRLRYASPEELKQEPGAQVLGGIERRALPQAARPAPAARERAARGIHWVWSAGMIVLAAILGAALPRVFTGTAAILRGQWAWSLLVGFIAFVCVPAAALIAMITLVGFPLALAAMALYFALLLIGYATTGVSLGMLGLQRWQPERSSHGGFRLLYAALGMLLVCLLAAIPYAGGFIVLAAMLLGIGALLQDLFKKAS